MQDQLTKQLIILEYISSSPAKLGHPKVLDNVRHLPCSLFATQPGQVTSSVPGEIMCSQQHAVRSRERQNCIIETPSGVLVRIKFYLFLYSEVAFNERR